MSKAYIQEETAPNPDEMTLANIQIGVLAIRLANRTPTHKETDQLTGAFKSRLSESNLQIEDPPIYFYKTDDKSKQDIKTLAGCVIKVKDKKTNQSRLIVAYHGTRGNNWGEIKADLKATKGNMKLDDGSDISIHKGFRDEYQLSSNQMKEAVRQMGGSELPILFSGHSLGGALSQIAALDLTSSSKCKIENTNIVTFGSPRVFSKETALRYVETGLSKATLLVRQARDIIPRLPPKAFYSHVGFKMKIPSESVSAHGGSSYRKGTDKIELKETGKIYSIRETDIMKEVPKKVSLREYVTSAMKLRKETLISILGIFKDKISTKRLIKDTKAKQHSAVDMMMAFRKLHPKNWHKKHTSHKKDSKTTETPSRG